MRENKLLKAVRERRPAVGPLLWTGSPAIAEFAGRFPFQWINLDFEHTPYVSYEHVEHLCRAAELAGLTPIASIGECDPLHITKLAEVGVMGFIVGHTITESDAQRAVDAAKYPPAGRRGAASTVRQMGYPVSAANWPEKSDRMNQEMVLIGKIEDYEALGNLDSILSTPIDALMVGSFDLSNSISRNLGIPEVLANVSHPKVLEARDLVFAKCKEYGKFGVGLLSQLQAEGGKTPAQVVEEWVPKGVLAYYFSSEFAILGNWYSQIANDLNLE